MVFTTIFNTFYSLLKTSAILLFLNDYFKHNFPEKYNEVFINLSYQIIYIFSKGQIIFFKTYNSIQVYFDKNPYLKHIINEILNKNKVIQSEILQIKNNGEILIRHYQNNLENYMENHFEDDNNSIYIYSNNINGVENNCINKIILHRQPFSFDYEVSNIKFILFEVKIADKLFKIDLKTDKYNYYIVNNIIDKRFLLYLLNDYQYCNLYENKDIQKIDVKIIDHNVNIKEFEISDTKFITIKKDDYV